jgi:putative lipoic acid-binding regulatory protein
MSEREATLQALNELHQFPGDFMFKVIGENSPELIAAVVQVAVTVLGPSVTPAVTTRESAHGRHQAITMVVQVPSAERVLEVYAGLKGVAGVKLLL